MLGYNTKAFWKQFLLSQLENNMPYLVEHSIKDFHVKGFNYICFNFSPNLTIRLYILEPSEPMDTSKINIHNHLYDSQILVLRGCIINNVYAIDNQSGGGTGYNHYYLTSALHPENKTGEIQLEYLGKVSLVPVESIELCAGMTHFQHHTEIHNVFNDYTQPTAFMIWEYPTVKQHSTLFSHKEYGTTLPTENAYNKYTEKEIRDLLVDLFYNL